MATASEDHTCKVWNAETGEEIHTLEGHIAGVKACTFSPDSVRLVTAGSDTFCKIWDLTSGDCLATLPLLGELVSVVHHPYKPRIACGDKGGSLGFVEMIGIALGPIVVTAVEYGDGPVVRCPVCFETYPLRHGWLGRVIDCPGTACAGRLKINPFIAGFRSVGFGSTLRRWLRL